MSEAGGGSVFNEENMPIIEEICDGMPGGFFIYRAYGKQELIYANKAMFRIFGCNDEAEFREHIGNSFKGIVHPDDYENIQKSIEEQVASNPNQLDFVEYRIICRDGTVRWVEDYGHFIETENYGEVFYVFIDDETDRFRKRMSELQDINAELKIMYSRESQYRKAILHNAVTFFEVDLSRDKLLSGIHNAESNKEAGLYNFSGVTEFSEWADCLAKHTDEKYLDDFRGFFSIERLIGCYENNEPEQVMDTVILDKFGKKKMLEIAVLMGTGELTGSIIALVVIKDITEAMEKKMIMQAALSEANAGNIARQSFLSNVSRDILAPINSIISFTELSSYNSSDADLLNYCLDKIKESGKQLLEIVGESLRINNMNSGGMKLRKLDCNLNRLLDEVKQRIMPGAAEKDIDFKIDRSGIKNFNVYAYEIRLEEVLLHLLDNAVKYTKKGGKVTLKVTEGEAMMGDIKNYIFLVEDNGIGISENFMDKIFEPFKREPSDVVSGINGSGMGLTVVKNHVDMMKGTVEVESVHGQGSRFKVTLPLTLHN